MVHVGKKLELRVGKLLMFVLAVRSCKISRAGMDGSGGFSALSPSEAAAGLGSAALTHPNLVPWGGIRGVRKNTASVTYNGCRIHWCPSAPTASEAGVPVVLHIEHDSFMYLFSCSYRPEIARLLRH